MLGNTFNYLAGMSLGMHVPGLNYLLFAFILIIGHVLNLALSCLGAFVHPLRLTFVEYFKNSGYEGTGRTYRPLK
jgi:V/A-type H+-transporting ATPase subunit I